MKKAIFEDFVIFTGKLQASNFNSKETPAQVFSSGYC